MTCPINVSHRPWETPELTAVNRLDAHACLIPFQDRGAALSLDREQSDWFRLLNGQWRFTLVPGPAEQRSRDEYTPEKAILPVSCSVGGRACFVAGCTRLLVRRTCIAICHLISLPVIRPSQ